MKRKLGISSFPHMNAMAAVAMPLDKNMLGSQNDNPMIHTLGSVIIKALVDIKLSSIYHKEMMSYLNTIEKIKINSFIFREDYLNQIVYKYCLVVLKLRKNNTPPTNEYLLKLDGFQHLEYENYKDKK